MVAEGEGDFTSYGDLVRSFYDRERFLLMLKEWILFFVKDDELRKTGLRERQMRAVTRVIERCADMRKRRGLVWHAQGSGKTFTMITAARLILQDKKRFPGATVMLVVDRNELEGQLAGWMERLLGDIQRGGVEVEHAYRKDRLQYLLDQDFRGLIISTIHKFDGIRKESCARDDVAPYNALAALYLMMRNALWQAAHQVHQSPRAQDCQAG